MARKSHRDSAVRFVTAKRGPERATKTRQYDLLRPRVGQKEPPRLGSTICYGQTWVRKSHQDSAVRFVTAKSWPERATKTRQYDLLRPRVGQKEPPRLGSTICYGQTWARKSHQDSAVRFVTAKSWPERATKTRQYDLLRPRVGQKEPPRLGSTICYGQTWARKSHQDSAVRFVTAKRGPERATKTRQYELLRPRRWPERATKTGQYDLLRPRRGPERATKTRQYDLLRPNVGQKEPPRLGSTICYGQDVGQKEPPRLGSTICKSHQDSAVRFVTAKTFGQKKPPRLGNTTCYGQDVGQKEPSRLGSMICYGQDVGQKRATKTRQYDLLRPRRGPEERATKTRQYDLLRPRRWPERATKTRQYDLLRPRRGPERATKTRQYDLLRPNVGQKEPPRLGSTICYGQELARKKPPRLGSTICYGQTWARKSHRDLAVRCVTANCGPERATKTRLSEWLRPRVGQKKPPRLGSTICYGQTWARKGHQDSAVRFFTAKIWPERATETRQYDLSRPNAGQKEPPRLGSTICYGQDVGQKEPPRLGSTICYGQTVGQKEPLRLGSTICYGQELARKSHRDSTVLFVTATRLARKSHQDSAVRFVTAKTCGHRKSHQDSAVRFVTAKSWPERATKTRQYDLLWPRVVCYGQTWARKSHQDSAVRFVTAKSCPERATETRQYDLLRPRVGQKEPPRLGSTICYGQDVGQKEPPEPRQYDLLRPRSWP